MGRLKELTNTQNDLLTEFNCLGSIQLTFDFLNDDFYIIVHLILIQILS